MAKLTLHFKTSLTTDPELDSIGWLWLLRLYASGRVVMNDNHQRTPPVHLLPILEKYVQDDESDEGKTSKTFDFQHDIILKELTYYEENQPTVNHLINHNIQQIVDVFKLNTVEQKILELRTIYRLHKAIEITLEECITDYWTENHVNQILAIALNVPLPEIEEALSPNGKLLKSGLIWFEKGLRVSFSQKLSVMEGLISAINKPASSIIELFSEVLSPSPASSLSLENFEHHVDDIQLLISYLKHAKLNKSVGVNILLYGLPGVGKTELARLFSKELLMTSYEVLPSADSEETQNDDGKMPERFRSYKLMQNMLSQISDSLIIFDEIEDVIPRSGLLDKLSSGRKAWLNCLLETNPVPTIWISNHVHQIDPAMMRRFDVVLEVKNLTIHKRIELLRNSLNSHSLNQQWIAKVAESHNLTPAIANKIMNVIECANIHEPKSIQMHFEKQMNERNSAQGIYKQSRYPKPEVFDISLLNTNIDIEKLVARAGKLSNAKVLLYGPPGTGKTAFAHYIAEVSNKPLLQKRSSDLVSPFIGETELNLKRMFDEAYSSNAILLLDEADSFLQSRANSSHQWEVSQVNELLTQMEAYQGIFICATNFMEHLDIASLRRFQFKVKFEYLNAQQVMKHFEWLINQTSALRVSERIDHQKSRLINLKNLTPADFQTVLEQFKILEETPTEPILIDELKNLSELKNDGNKNIGFLH